MESVEIVHLDTASSSSPLLEVNEDAFKEILSSVDENAIVISIVGPLQSGKSFLMNFASCYLKSLEEDRQESWMYQDSPVRGFRFQPSTTVVTRGISILPQAFRVNNRPVYLIDTRGVFEQETSLREWAGIVGTCLAVSTCTVFNVQTLLHDEYLIYLDSFIEYGKILSKNISRDEEAMKIGNLMFLVRDWNNPSEFDYGSEGGQAFILKKFSTENPGMTEEAKRVRMSVISAVRDISCYLMPHPGDTVNSVVYDRPLDQGVLHGPFEQSLEHLMPTLFNSEKLLNAGTNSLHRIAEFVQVFNTIFTSVKRTPDITAHMNYEMSVYQGIRFYEETQRRKLKKKSKLQPTYIDEHHGELKKYLLEMFQKRRQYGSQQLKQEYTAKLDEMLEKSRIRLKEEVVSEQEALAQQAKAEAISAVRSKLEELSVSETLSPSALEKVWTRAKEDVLTQQKTKFKKLGTDSRSELQQNLESALLKVYEESQKRCQQLQEQVLAEHRDVLKESVRKYEERMEIISDGYISDSRFDKIHQTSLETAMKHLGNSMKVPDDAPDMKQRILENFNQLTQTARAQLEKRNQEYLDSFNSSKKKVIAEALESFQRKAEEVVQSSVSVERKISQLKEIRTDIQEDALGKVEELNDVPAELLSLSRKEIKQKIEEILKKFTKKVEDKAAEQNSLAEVAVNEALNKLRRTLQIFSEKIMKPDALTNVLNTAKKDVLDSVSENLRNIGVTDPAKYLPELNAQIDTVLELASQQNQSSYQAMVGNLRVAMETSIRQFTDAVEELKREERNGGDTSSALMKEETRALDSYDITVEPLHYPVDESARVRESLRRQLETKRQEYEKYFLELSQQSQEEILTEMVEKAEEMIKEKLTSYSKGIQILSQEDFMAYWKKARDAVVIHLELDLMRSNRLPPAAAMDMIEKVGTVLTSYKTWQKRSAVNRENEEEIRRSMERFVDDFKDRTKDIGRDDGSRRRIGSKKNSVLTDFRLSFTCTKEEIRTELMKEMEEKLDQVVEELEDGEPMDCTPSVSTTALSDTNILNDRPTQIVPTNGIVVNTQRVQHEPLQGSETQLAPARNHDDNESGQFERLRQRMLSQFKSTTPQGLCGISRVSVPLCLKNFDKESELFQLTDSRLYEVYRNLLKEDLEAFCKQQDEQQPLQEIGSDTSLSSNISRRLPTGDLDDIREKVARFYRGAMDVHFVTPSYYQTQRFTEFHTTACSEAKDQIHRSLDPEDMKEVQAVLDQIFKQYEAKNQMNTPTSFAIGIDLGTTYSCVGVYINGNVEIIANSDRGQKTTPSYVSFDKDHKPIVGEAAKEQAHLQPERTAYEVKRLIGRRLDDPAIQEDLVKWPFKVVNERGAPKVLIGEKTYHPEEISALLLKKLRRDAEDYVGDEVKYAVITVPAYFTDGQRNATKNAGEAAGLHVLRIINEPTAAAVAYNLNWNKDQKPIKGLVYDFGGGTFDVAIFEANKGEIKIIAVGGDTHLGGADFDNEMVNHCIKKFRLAEGEDLEEGKETSNGLLAVNRRKMRMKGMCEKGKKGLSGASETTISMECIYGSKDLNVKITRVEFEAMINKHVAKSLECVEETLRDAKLRKQDIEEIILIGGSTRIPRVRLALTEYFGRPVNFRINPDEAVAYGAAFEAAVLNGARAQREGDIRSAAIAPVGMSIKDVTPMSLGIEIDGGDMSVLIPRQSQVPIEVSHTYMTAYNNQTSVQIVIWEGEKPKATENTQVAEFYLNGIPPAKAGTQRIRVTMKVNDEGIITVTAVCIENGVEKSLTVRDNKKRITKKDRGG